MTMEFSLRTKENHEKLVRITVVAIEIRTPEYKVLQVCAKPICLEK